MKVVVIWAVLAIGLPADVVIADPPQDAAESKPGPRETFVEYFRAMDAGERDAAKSLKTPDCSDTLHIDIRRTGIVDRLRPFYEYSSPSHALVVAAPVDQEVICSHLVRRGREWKIKSLARTDPDNVSWLAKGFQLRSDVKLDLTAESLVGTWWYPCDSKVVLDSDGSGSELEVGPAGPYPDEIPDAFTWTVDGATLIRRFEDREDRLVVSSIDHESMHFETTNRPHRYRWDRVTPVTVIADRVVENRFRMAINKMTEELDEADLEKEFWRLDFRNAPISDEGLKEVAKIKQVKNLLFDGAAVFTDAGLKEVSKLSRLEGLSLMGTDITDAGLNELSNLQNIDNLNLQNTNVTSAGLTRLLKAWNSIGEQGGERSSTLQYLLLDNCKGIDDAALAEVSKLRHLKGLQLGNTGVTDAGLKELAKLKSLENLHLGNTQVTSEAVKRLQEQLPGCRIRDITKK